MRASSEPRRLRCAASYSPAARNTARENAANAVSPSMSAIEILNDSTSLAVCGQAVKPLADANTIAELRNTASAIATTRAAGIGRRTKIDGAVVMISVCEGP